MTGRAAGFCAGYSTPGYANFGAGRGVPGPSQGAGYGGGRGGGRGYRNRYYATGLYGWQRDMAFQAPPPYAPPSYAAPQIPPQQEVEALQEQLKYMEDGIKATQQRISELEEQKDQE